MIDTYYQGFFVCFDIHSMVESLADLLTYVNLKQDSNLSYIVEQGGLIRRKVFNSKYPNGALYGKDFTRGFDTQNYPKLWASLGTQPENTNRTQRQTQPNPYPWICLGNTKFLPLGTMGTHFDFLPLGTMYIIQTSV